MKVCFFSNFLNHHQLPFCLEMQKKLGNDFVFVAFEKIPNDRLKLGYYDMNSQYDFVIRAYESEEAHNYTLELNMTADVVIAGSAPENLILMRANAGKVIFRYSERLYKTGLRHMFSPQFIRELYQIHSPLRRKPVYLLCAGGYVASDFAFLRNYVGKTYKWGYFPEFIKYDVEKLIADKTCDSIRILWVGRLIDWKHPEIAVELANLLKRKGYRFILDIIGDGNQRRSIQKLIQKNSLMDCVHLLGAKHPEEVREYMEKAHIFLFTSDRNEGWGAVLNEAMNSGCAVLCNQAIGAVPFLVKNKENGIVYKNANVKNLFRLIQPVLENSSYRNLIARNAYYTIADEWNAKRASERFLQLANCMIGGGQYSVSTGICSKC